MRLSWNEIRARAARFADEWKDARYEKGETQSYYNDLFEVFGVKRRRFASFEEPVKLLGTRRGFIDLFWKGVLLIEQKSAGRSLVPAKSQALDCERYSTPASQGLRFFSRLPFGDGGLLAFQGLVTAAATSPDADSRLADAGLPEQPMSAGRHG